MRKLFALLFLGLIYSGILKGQVVISGDFAKNPECEIKIKLVDSVSSKPLEMATVYLQPKGDTNIIYFNLTDTAGTAVLRPSAPRSCHSRQCWGQESRHRNR